MSRINRIVISTLRQFSRPYMHPRVRTFAIFALCRILDRSKVRSRWDIKDKIIFALRDAIDRITGADSFIKAAVGSYGDTLSPEDVLSEIKQWTAIKSKDVPSDVLFAPGSLVRHKCYESDQWSQFDLCRIQAIKLDRTGRDSYLVCGCWVGRDRLEAIPGQPTVFLHVNS